MKPTIEEVRKFYGASHLAERAVLHEGKDGASDWIERFLSNVNKEANEAEGTIVHLISTPRIDPVFDVMDPFGVDDRALRKNRAVFTQYIRHLQAHGFGRLTMEFSRHRVVQCRPEPWDDPAELLELQETEGPGV